MKHGKLIDGKRSFEFNRIGKDEYQISYNNGIDPVFAWIDTLKNTINNIESFLNN